MSAEPTTYDVVATRIFDVPVAQIWQAWSESEQVRQWWGPVGFTSPLAEMDFREGGTSLVCMRAPAEYGGQDMYNTWTYRKIEPHKLIEYVNRFSDKDGTSFDPAQMGLQGVPQEVRHVVTFRPAGENRTEMTITEYGFFTEQARDMSSSGLEQCLDKMAASFARV